MPLARSHIAPEFPLVDIVKGQPVPYPMSPCIGCRKPFGMVTVGPVLTRLWTNLQRPEFVEGDGWAIGRRLVYITSNYFFFDLSLGSLHSFQVFVRRSLTFRSCRIVRRVSMLIEETIFS
jgi:hypothetical protein